jgi:hypothetical protein
MISALRKCSPLLSDANGPDASERTVFHPFTPADLLRAMLDGDLPSVPPFNNAGPTRSPHSRRTKRRGWKLAFADRWPRRGGRASIGEVCIAPACSGLIPREPWYGTGPYKILKAAILSALLTADTKYFVLRTRRFARGFVRSASRLVLSATVAHGSRRPQPPVADRHSNSGKAAIASRPASWRSHAAGSFARRAADC